MKKPPTDVFKYVVFSLSCLLLQACSHPTRGIEINELSEPGQSAAVRPTISKKKPQRSKKWKDQLQDEVANLGAGNWIVVAEKAFPIPQGEGVKVIHADAELAQTLLSVFDSIESEGHVWPKIYNLREFKYVGEDYAPGVGKLRAQKEVVFAGRKMQEVTARTADLIFNAAIKKYRVLIVKTESAYPYSSVFMELDSGYWNGISEDALRKSMPE